MALLPRVEDLNLEEAPPRHFKPKKNATQKKTPFKSFGYLATSRHPPEPANGQKARTDQAEGGLLRVPLPPDDVAVQQAAVRAGDGQDDVDDGQLVAGVEVEGQQADDGGARVAGLEHRGRGRGGRDAARKAEFVHRPAGVEERPHPAECHR